MSRDEEGFLSRWSRRKSEARQPEAPARAPGEAPAAAARATASALPTAAPEAAPLPSLESLTPNSDFSAFMRPEVDASLKGQALKTLFSDPALYPMDGLDVYIDDYTKPDPLPEGWLGKLKQFANLHGEPAPQQEAQAPDAAAAVAPEAATDAAPEAGTQERSAASDTPGTTGPAPESDNRGTT